MGELTPATQECRKEITGLRELGRSLDGEDLLPSTAAKAGPARIATPNAAEPVRNLLLAHQRSLCF
jgi:hypothetical protein